VNLDGRRPTPAERADWAALAARSEFLPVTFLLLRPALDDPLLDLPALEFPLLELLAPPEERADLAEIFLMLNSYQF
jgi:hypothetical protein